MEESTQNNENLFVKHGRIRWIDEKEWDGAILEFEEPTDTSIPAINSIWLDDAINHFIGDYEGNIIITIEKTDE